MEKEYGFSGGLLQQLEKERSLSKILAGQHFKCLWMFTLCYQHELVQVSSADSKYREIKNLFQQTMNDYSIRRLWRTQSLTLWQHFQLFVSALLHSPSGSGAVQIVAGPPSCPPSVWVVPPWQKANCFPPRAALCPSPRGLRHIPREWTTPVIWFIVEK
ncbi:hypothetical protein Q9233_001689 [Columba guinea]|nr:hypothetical protein Q9233_001689 [Columba guinea]